MVSFGCVHSVIVADGNVVLFGGNGQHQLGTMAPRKQSSPTIMPFFQGKNIDMISAGGTHTMVVAGGDLYTFGHNEFNQCGRSNCTIDYNAASPGIVPKFLGESIEMVSGGGHHSTALVDGDVFTWGRGCYGATGWDGAMSIVTKHELVLAIIGGLFVLETVSVIVQVASFKLTGKRVFAMAPLHHHFEKKGWAESTIVIRFWIIASILALIGLATLKLR